LLNSCGDPVDNRKMDFVMQWCAMALTSSVILRWALIERTRLVAELARVRVDGRR